MARIECWIFSFHDKNTIARNIWYKIIMIMIITQFCYCCCRLQGLAMVLMAYCCVIDAMNGMMMLLLFFIMMKIGKCVM